MSQAGPALRCLLDEAKHRDAGTFMKSAAMAAEGRYGNSQPFKSYSG
jgi:hypothetical protein